MPTKELLCPECDCVFTVKMSKGYQINFCPACGEELGQDNDIIEFEDE